MAFSYIYERVLIAPPVGLFFTGNICVGVTTYTFSLTLDDISTTTDENTSTTDNMLNNTDYVLAATDDFFSDNSRDTLDTADDI